MGKGKCFISLWLLRMKELKFFKLQAVIYCHNHFFRIFCSIWNLPNTEIKNYPQSNASFLLLQSLLNTELGNTFAISVASYNFWLKLYVVLTDGIFPIGMWWNMTIPQTLSFSFQYARRSMQCSCKSLNVLNVLSEFLSRKSFHGHFKCYQ